MLSKPSIDKKFHQIYWQTWSQLVFVHWAVSPAAIAAILPGELEPDLYEGKAYVGLVPFRMSAIRPVFLPALPGLSRTLETNIRTYVKLRNCQGDPTPAVWFFSLEAENPVAVILARLGYGLPYFQASMWLNSERDSAGMTHYSAGSVRHWPKPAPVESVVEARFADHPLEPARARSVSHCTGRTYEMPIRLVDCGRSAGPDHGSGGDCSQGRRCARTHWPGELGALRGG
ncbi:MAG: DUF2071 domain-containing protein [Planctomycetota bacterium]|nr:DUF2071 domain-containing protein [Planctomycetota bacterium]